MSCNYPKIPSCSTLNERVDSPPSIEEITLPTNVDILKILEYLNSNDEKNKLTGIEIAKGVLGLDCYDLFCIKRKIAMRGQTSEDIAYTLYCEWMDIFVNGWIIDTHVIDSHDGFMVTDLIHTITLNRINFFGKSPQMQLIIYHNESHVFNDIFFSEGYKDEPYKQFLLKY